ncbi:MAG: FAD-linked oxidase C-terminal domain-containing protein [Gammaproteobacteria bacterium]
MSQPSARLLEELRGIFGERVSDSRPIREHHGRDESHHPLMPPDLVVFAQSAEEVSAVVRTCTRYRVPIIPFGAGTSVEGHISALQGGVCIDCSSMNEILHVNVEDMNATVQPGVTRQQLNEYLRDTGLFFSVDPGAEASIGGMAATRASGTNTVRYGTIRDNVLSLQVVLPDGEVIRTGRPVRKSAAGYDLTHLFIGSEGTLGIITELTLKLHGIPEMIASAVCAFPTVEAAVTTVIQTIQCGIPVARCELLDEVLMGAVNRRDKLAYAEAPTLFLEFHGSEAMVEEQSRLMKELAAENGGTDFLWATDNEERNRLWHARHNAYYAGLALRPGCRAMATDVCVPISRLAECVAETKRELDRSPLTGTILGHVGDGNFHTMLLIDPDSPDELAEAERINKLIVQRALEVGGTCTGEHGVGFGKIPYMRAEHGDALKAMRLIKQAFDPHNLMNPGKVLPPPEG